MMVNCHANYSELIRLQPRPQGFFPWKGQGPSGKEKPCGRGRSVSSPGPQLLEMLWKSPYLSEKFISKTKIFWEVEKKMNFMFDFIGITKLDIIFCPEDYGHIFSLDHC